MALDVSTLSLDVDSRDLEKAIRELRNVPPAARRAEQSVDQLGREFSTMGTRGVAAFRSMAGTVGAVSGLLASYGVFEAVKNSITAFADYETQMLRLEGTIRATGGTAGRSAEQINGIAEAIGKMTLASDDNVRDAAAQLLTFKAIVGDTFDRTLWAAQDLADLGFGSIESSAVQLAKALEDPVRGLGALRRVGVSFTADQEDLIKSLVETNQKLEAQDVLLKAVEAQVGGASVRAASGLAGAYDSLSEEIDDFVVRTGGQIAELIELEAVIKRITGYFADLNYRASPVGAYKTFAAEQSDQIEELNTNLARMDERIRRVRDKGEAAGLSDLQIAEQWAQNDRVRGTGEGAAIIEQFKRRESLMQQYRALEQGARYWSTSEAYTAAAAAARMGDPNAPGGSGTDPGAGAGSGSDVKGRAASAAAAEAQATAYDNVMAALIAERDAIGMTEQARRQAEEIRAAEVDATGTQADAIRALVEELYRLEEAQERAELGAEVLSDAFSELAHAAIEDFDNIGDALGSLASRLGSTLIDLGIENMVSGMMGGTGNPLATGLGWLFGRRASGGPVSAGAPYLVGERGPEIVVPRSSGTVVPNHHLGGGRMAITVNVQGARGNSEIREMVEAGVSQGLRAYDTRLADRVSEISADPRFRG